MSPPADVARLAKFLSMLRMELIRRSACWVTTASITTTQGKPRRQHRRIKATIRRSQEVPGSVAWRWQHRQGVACRSSLRHVELRSSVDAGVSSS